VNAYQPVEGSKVPKNSIKFNQNATETNSNKVATKSGAKT
jgi:hypothetical protein